MSDNLWKQPLYRWPRRAFWRIMAPLLVLVWFGAMFYYFRGVGSLSLMDIGNALFVLFVNFAVCGGAEPGVMLESKEWNGQWWTTRARDSDHQRKRAPAKATAPTMKAAFLMPGLIGPHRSRVPRGKPGVKTTPLRPCSPPFPQNSPIKYRRINWTLADWTLPDAEIARRLDVLPIAVYQRRKRHGIPPSHQKRQRFRPHKPRFDWNSVDWSWTNARIAQALGCSITAVLYRRRLQGVPFRRGWRQSLPPAKPRFAWDKVDWKWPDAKIAQTLGCTVTAVRFRRRKRATP